MARRTLLVGAVLLAAGASADEIKDSQQIIEELTRPHRAKDPLDRRHAGTIGLRRHQPAGNSVRSTTRHG